MFQIRCEVPPDPVSLRVGSIWQDGPGPIVLQLPTGPIRLDESTLGPRLVPIDDDDFDDDAQDDADDQAELIGALSIVKYAERWRVYGTVPNVTLLTPRLAPVGNWFCQWSLMDGVLKIHAINLETLKLIHPYFVRGQDCRLVDESTRSRGGLSSCAVDYRPPAPKTVTVDWNGTMRIMQPQEVSSVGPVFAVPTAAALYKWQPPVPRETD